MAAEAPASQDLRVLLLAPTRRDAEVTGQLLQRADVRCEACSDAHDVSLRIPDGVGALLMAEHVLLDRHIDELLAVLERQPAWSDIPVVLLTRDREPTPLMGALIDRFSNLTLLDRPTSTRSLLSAVLSALRARRRQYQMRDELLARQRAEAALRQADQRKDEFLATLAHELRNPLAPISTGLQVLARFATDSPQAQRTRELMGRQVVQLVKLIDELLDVSRIASGKVNLQRERLDLRAVVTAALEACQPAIDEAGHGVRLQMPEQALYVVGDFTRLLQVVSNLLNNACKYTPNGGRIEIELAGQGDEARLKVRDNGTGIPPDLLDRVFDIFAQVQRTLDRAQGGLGIGLSLARRLVDLHGGSISAASPGPDRGSTFTLRLPLAAAASAAPDALPAAAGRPAGQRPLRVLVVDDNRDAADSLALLLRLGGHHTRTEYRGGDALRVAAEFQPEVVFCDLGMPGIDGHEVARRLRAPGQPGPVVLVALTGWGSEEDKQRTRDAGFDFHLVKPVAVEMLDEILKTL